MEYNLEDYLKLPLPFEEEIKDIFNYDAPITIFEIGACEGEDTIKLRRRFPRAEIYAFEPLPKNIVRMKKNYKKYSVEKINISNVALSKADGEAEFYVSSGHPEDQPKTKDWDFGNKSSSLLKPKEVSKTHEWMRFDKKIKVTTRRMDTFCKDNSIPRVDFIYMDVQGAELMVMEGGGTLLNNVAAVWMEVEAIELYADQPLKDAVDHFMRQRGFVCVIDTVNHISGDRLYVRKKRRTFQRLAGISVRKTSRTTQRVIKKLRKPRPKSPLSQKHSKEVQLTVGTKNLNEREAWLEKTLNTIPKSHRILDAGAGELQYKRFCSHLDYVSQDFGGYDGQGNQQGLQMESWDNSLLDIVSDIAEIPEKPKSFNAIMCIEVFEHIPHPTEAIQEFSRLMKKGGKLIITTPVSSLTHFAPFYFYNGYSRYYFEKVLPEHGFIIKEITYNGNFFEYVAQELRRLESVSEKYSERHTPFTSEEQIARDILLSKLQRLTDTDTGSSEILSLGIMVVAEKI